MNEQSLASRIAEIDWMHTIDLGNGLTTPGRWPVNPRLLKVFDKIDFKGKKVLDIGTCNGLWSFEAEKRGAAEIHSIDFLTNVGYWCSPGYRLAHEALGSKAHYNPDLDVYDIEKLGITDFDVVVFSGVYYHLKHPLYALSKIRRIMKKGGSLVVEGPVYPDTEVAYSSFHYKDVLLGDKSNWNVPTLKCLREWLECSFFDIREELPENPSALTPSSRLKSRLRKTLDASKLEDTMRVVMLAESVTRKETLYASIDPDLSFAFEQ